jgi:pSer/pThr/pTyr-binding forkhead associated (FHA) protein
MQLRMKVVKGKPEGHCIAFPAGEFVFGRWPECNVRPNSDLVSRQHCLLKISANKAIIRDLGSRNGTLVNGQLVVGERILEHGDTLQLGPLVLEVIVEAGNATISETALARMDETTIASVEQSQPAIS